MSPRLACAALVLTSVVARAADAQSTAPDTSGPPPAVTTALSYTGELVSDASGGAQRGVVYTGVAGAQLTLSLSRLVGWRHAGYIMILYLAGLKSVDPSLREAAG